MFMYFCRDNERKPLLNTVQVNDYYYVLQNDYVAFDINVFNIFHQGLHCLLRQN